MSGEAEAQAKTRPTRTTRGLRTAPPVGVLVVGGAYSLLQKMPSGIARCCVTSPPYWGLRDYDLPGQIGVESDVDVYVRKLVRVFGEVHRVLADDGTLWLNIGDSYTSGNRGWRAPDPKNSARAMRERPPNPKGLKEKELVGVPWRLAFALQQQGWYLRSDIIWSKPNSQPESVKDRPSQSHEYLFLFSKSKNYYYDYGAVKEPTVDGLGYKNRRSVWTFNARPGIGLRAAPFPPDLVSLCIKAGTSSGDVVLDPFFGSGTVGAVSQAEGRSFIGVELNPLYAELAVSKIGGEYLRVLGRESKADKWAVTRTISQLNAES